MCIIITTRSEKFWQSSDATLLISNERSHLHPKPSSNHSEFLNFNTNTYANIFLKLTKPWQMKVIQLLKLGILTVSYFCFSYLKDRTQTSYDRTKTIQCPVQKWRRLYSTTKTNPSSVIPMQSENLTNNDKRALSPQIAYLTTIEASKQAYVVYLVKTPKTQTLGRSP